jgi:hypothetical protein
VNRSIHTTDRLIRELIETRRAATNDEVEQIVERMASAPFEPRDISVPSELRGKRYLGNQLGARAPVLLVHPMQRVMLDRQWADGTTEDEYLEDLRRAVRAPAAHVVVYERRGGHVAAVLAPNTIPANRRGLDALPWIYVVHSADRGTMISGYQATSLQAISIPEDARWLT